MIYPDALKTHLDNPGSLYLDVIIHTCKSLPYKVVFIDPRDSDLIKLWVGVLPDVFRDSLFSFCSVFLASGSNISYEMYSSKVLR